MKFFLTSILLLGFLIACSKNDTKPAPEGFVKGEVLETMNSGGYTYMKLETDNGEQWIASAEMEVKKGETVYYNEDAMVMENFESKTLGKTFEKIIFADKVLKNPEEISSNSNENMMMGGKNPHGSIVGDKLDNIDIKPGEGGYSIADIYANRNELNGKTVKVKGQIVKYNEAILNTNWIHIQDGSGTKEANNFDLAITSNEPFAVGEIVEFEGVLAVEKDFGSGYKFTVIVENAKSLSKEKATKNS